MTKCLILACVAAAVSTAASAQNAPKPITRADFVKIVDTRFNQVDANRDGTLSRDELAATRQREIAKAQAMLTKRMQDQFRQLDTNKDGKLSLQEFLGGAPKINTTETPEQLVRALDKNGDGKVSADEYRAPELAKFNRFDANRDGIVTPAEMQAASGK